MTDAKKGKATITSKAVLANTELVRKAFRAITQGMEIIHIATMDFAINVIRYLSKN